MPRMIYSLKIFHYYCDYNESGHSKTSRNFYIVSVTGKYILIMLSCIKGPFGCCRILMFEAINVKIMLFAMYPFDQFERL